VKITRYSILAFAEGLSHYKINLSKWVKTLNVASAVKRLFTPALNIISK